MPLFNFFYSVKKEWFLILSIHCWFLVSVRRSGRLSNIRRPNRDNEEYETIDLTFDGDSENEQGIVYSFLEIICFYLFTCYVLKWLCKLRYWWMMCMSRITCGKYLANNKFLMAGFCIKLLVDNGFKISH